MIIPLKLKLLLITSLILSGCKLKEKLDTPRENDLVVWKQNPQLIVKAKLGPRRKHIPDQFDYEFYRPAREHYLGQFPIEYVPEKFAPITQEQADNFGESKHNNLTGVLLDIRNVQNNEKPLDAVAIRGNSYEPNKYGGVWIQWETDFENWDKWQEIDRAIWRLLETWNAAPLNHNPVKQKRDSLS